MGHRADVAFLRRSSRVPSVPALRNLRAMSDQAKPPVSPPATFPHPTDRKPSGAAPTSPRPVIVLPLVRPSGTHAQPAQPSLDSSQSEQNGTSVAAQGASWTSTSGRPLDVTGDVQQTSALAASLALQAARSSDGAALTVPATSGRQVDVQIAPAQTAITGARGARTTNKPRRTRSRKRAELDEDRGRFRHTIRLEPKVEQKLRTVAEILGIDLNAAIAVCISVHHHRLTKPGADS